MAKKKEESTNEKIVRLYKEGYNFDEISRTMEIPKGNIIGIVEKYFPDYQSYVQPTIDHAALEEKDNKERSSKSKFNVPGIFSRNKGDKDNHAEAEKLNINIDMDENGFIDRTVQGIAQMLKKGRSVADTAEFFNKEKAEVQAVHDVMDEHFKRVEAAKAAEAAAKEPEIKEQPVSAFSKKEEFSTGLEPEKPVKKASKSKYQPPVYSKRTDPKPVSASYGLANNEKNTSAAETAQSISLFDEKADTANIDLTQVEKDTTNIDLTKVEKDTANIDLTAVEPEKATIDLVADAREKKQEHSVSLLDEAPAQSTAPAVEETPEMPSIESVSLEALDALGSRTQKPAETTPEIPDINYSYESTSDKSKEEDSDMTPMEKMKQFAQEQIALNNQKIEELKTKKTDAENNAFDCNTKVESMKREIEEMQAKLLVLIDEKDKAGKIVSDINDEIEAINKENAEYGSYL